GTLAVPGDNVFRFTPDESKEGEALAAVLADDGITTVVPVHRDDPGNAGLVVGLRAAFGGTVTDPVIYGADETDFTGAIEDIIAALQAAGGSPQETGIFLAAFAEVVDLFEVAASLSNDALRSVQWYGSDSVALLPDLVENADAAGFAMVVGYPNPIL